MQSILDQRHQPGASSHSTDIPFLIGYCQNHFRIQLPVFVKTQPASETQIFTSRTAGTVHKVPIFRRAIRIEERHHCWLRLVGLSALPTQAPCQSLGYNRQESLANTGGVHPKVAQPLHCSDAVVGMQCAENQVSGHGCPKTGLGSLLITNFADQNDVRILAQESAGIFSKGITDGLIYLVLTNPLQIILYRILSGNNLSLCAVEVSKS